MITVKYVEFILDYVGDTSRVQLDEPQEDGSFASWKLGPIVSVPVKIEVLNKYTRSANLRLSFDKYQVDHLFFMPLNSSPDSIIIKTHRKIEKIVNKTLLDDGREDEIRKMYADKRAFIEEQFIKVQGKIAELNKNNSDKTMIIKAPCKPDHNGECLICDCWLDQCAYDRYLNQDYKYETKEELEKMFGKDE